MFTVTSLESDYIIRKLICQQVKTVISKACLGRKLLQELENQFKGQGYNNINLVTSHFQAQDFYKKRGFIAEFTRVDKKNPKLSKTFFVKYFDEENQFQGVLKGRQ